MTKTRLKILAVNQIDKQIKDWSKDFKKTGIPKCMTCGTQMEMAYDSILKKKSKYLWKHKCKCSKLQLVIG